MGTKYVSLNERLYRYLCRFRSDATDPLLKQLRRQTAALGGVSKCQISDEQGTFLSILVAAIGARRAIEVGTFTGYSSLCIARSLPANGRLICLDESAEWTAVAQKYWAKAGLQDRIELRLGAAIPALKQLEPGLTFDFAFIDADKTEYDTYYELLLPRVRRNGLLLFDNIFAGRRNPAVKVNSQAGFVSIGNTFTAADAVQAKANAVSLDNKVVDYNALQVTIPEPAGYR